jgi:hypothetical protein
MPQRGCRSRPRFSPLIFVHPMGTWKMPLDGTKEHRLEAYVTLLSGLSSDLLEPPELSPCTRSGDATALM